MGLRLRWALALIFPLLLAGCLLTPGKFTSEMTIRADRSFAFAYKGEVIAIDPSDSMTGDGSSENSKETAEAKADKARKAAERETKRRAVAEALSREAGYRSVQYLGNGKYVVDYAIAGRLDHGFVYPFNSDAEVMLPFIAIELRRDGNVRMKAPAFGAQSSGKGGIGGMPGLPDGSDMRDGSFTLLTDATIVMHNNEGGVAETGGMKTLTWRVTPLSKDPPTAVLDLGG